MAEDPRREEENSGDVCVCMGGRRGRHRGEEYGRPEGAISDSSGGREPGEVEGANPEISGFPTREFASVVSITQCHAWDLR